MQWKKWLTHFRTLGIQPHLGFEYAQRIELLNIGAAFLIVLNLINAVIFRYVMHIEEIHYYFIATALFYTMFPLLNYWQMNRFARLLFILFINGNVLLFVRLFGTNTYFQYYFTSTIIAAVLLFTRKELIEGIASTLLPIVLIIYTTQIADFNPLYLIQHQSDHIQNIQTNNMLSISLINLFVIWISDRRLRHNSHLLDQLIQQSQHQKELFKKKEEALQKERIKIETHQANLESIIHQRTKALLEKQEELQSLLQDYQRKIIELSQTKEALHQARQEEAKFVQTVTYSTDCILLFYESGQLLYLNPSAQQLLEIDNMQTHSLIELLTTDSQHAFGQAVEQTQTPPNYWRGELTLLSAQQKKTISCDALIFSVKDSTQSQQLCLAGIFRDIRQQKADQRRLQEMQLQLIEKEKMASIGLLTSGIAHELKNPVNFIVGSAAPLKRYIDYLQHIIQAAEKLVQQYSRQHIEELKQLLDQAHGQELLGDIKDLTDALESGAERINSIVSDLLSFARTESQRQQCNLNYLVQQSLRFIRSEIDHKGIQLDWKPYEPLPSIEGYPSKLQQIIINLCNNAIQAMPKGGILRIRTWHMKSQEVLLTVEDTGIGMSEEVRRHIFEPFFTTKNTGEGTGLGLFIVYGIVQQHGGSIQVESQPGVGTTFQLRFPTTAPEDE